MVVKILLVGAGVTSSLIGNLLRKMNQKPIELVVWDKARGTGGRMSTIRHQTKSGSVDIGAQYITCLPENSQFHSTEYESLLYGGVLEPLTARIVGLKDFPEGTRHYVAPNGMNSVVKHFLKDVFSDIRYNSRVVSLLKVNGQWQVKTEAGHQEIFDIVVLTIPVPQILQLSGAIQEIIAQKSNLENAMNSVKFSSRYALGLFYTDSKTINEPWDVKYMNDQIFRYAAVDNRKRNRPDDSTSVVLHTSVQYGKENVDRAVDDVQIQLLQHLRMLFPHWPEPEHVKCHKWRYSQVVEPYPGTPGFAIIEQEPLLLAAGDSFSKSTFDGCITSAKLVSQKITEVIGGQ